MPHTPSNPDSCAKDQEHSSSGVTHHASQLCSAANLTEDLQNIASFEINGKSSAREQIIVELTNSRVKQKKKKRTWKSLNKSGAGATMLLLTGRRICHRWQEMFL